MGEIKDISGQDLSKEYKEISVQTVDKLKSILDEKHQDDASYSGDEMKKLNDRYLSLFQTNINIDDLKRKYSTYQKGRDFILTTIIKAELKRDYNYTESELNTLLSKAVLISS